MKNTSSENKFSKYLLLFQLLFFNTLFLFSQKDIDDVKKQAEKAFNEENYVEAYKLYSQLVANFSKEPLYNYRLGVAMIYAEPDKKKCIPYLDFAIKFVHKKEVPPEALFYLAKAYHINYRFNDAIKYYKEYKQNVSASKAREMLVDREIQSCESGRKLLSTIKELIVLSKKQLNETEYFRSYDLSTIGGKLLVKPDEFQSKIDKKKKDKSVMYLPQTGDKVFFASYGEDGKNGKDIYFAIRLPNGTFAKPQPLTAINSPYDEDFPFLHPNGKVLYFASKGYNSMGGYDIFKSKYDEATQTWSPPENLEFPINSPGDDFLFVTDSSEKIAFFSTSRYSPPGKIDVLKIKTERVPPAFVTIKGNVRKSEINQSVRSVIAVKNIETGELVGTFAANENGEYYMELPNGGKFLFTVETPGFTKQSESVNLPLSFAVKPLRQTISYEKNTLIITNYFDEAAKEDSYLDIVEFIEKKAQLDVNENQFNQTTQQPIASNITNVSEKKDISNEVKNNAVNASNTPIPPNNTRELIDIVKKDVDEMKFEVNQLENENKQLQQIIQLKEQEIKEIDKNIVDTQKQIQTAETNEEKEQLTQLLKDLQEKKKNAEEQKQFFEEYQKETSQNLENKKKEYELNQQFLSALQELESGKNTKANLTKLETIQKELQTLEKQKIDKTEITQSLSQQEKEKQQELSKLYQQKQNKEKDIQLLQDEMNNLKNELSSTKDKNLRDNIQTQIEERESELKTLQTQLISLNEKIKDINEDLSSIQEQKELLAKIKNNEPILSNATQPSVTSIITTTNINQITNEYSNKINATESDNEKIKIIDEYNKLLIKSIEENKKQIANSSNLSERQKLQNLNYELEQILKSNNDQLIALNNKNQPQNISNNNLQIANNQQKQNITQENKINQPQNISDNQPQIANNQKQQGRTPESKNQPQNISNDNPQIANNQQQITNNQSQIPNNQQQQNVTQENKNQPINNSSALINQLPFTISNSNETVQNITANEQAKSEFIALKNQFENQEYQSSAANPYKQNIPSLPDNNPLAQNILTIINAQQQINFFTQQKDSLRKLSNELKTKVSKTTDNAQKQKLLNDAKKTDIAALEKEYQITQFTKTLNQNTFQVYENTFNSLPDNQKQILANEINKAKQNFKQAEQIRKEAINQNNLAIKIAAEQNAQEKEQIALNTISNAFKQNNIIVPPTNFNETLQSENKFIQSNLLQLQKQYINANNTEIAYLINIADTSQKIKNNPSYSQSLVQLKDIQKNIEKQIAKNESNPSKETQNAIINNQLQLLQQLRQITTITQPSAVAKNDFILQEHQNILKSNFSKDSALIIAQNIPINISSNSISQIQSLLQEQKQIEDNLKTSNPITKSKDEILKTNEILNTEITQLTNKALNLKQKIAQTTNPKQKAELQTEFDRTNALIQEKKLLQISNEILINQADYIAQQNLINQLISAIPNNKSIEKNNAINTNNEIQKLKKQEENLIKEALALSNPSAQLGALQNAKIKQQEYIQAQQQLIQQIQKYNPDAKPFSLPVNINDPLALTLKYQSNLQKQIKEWESINNNLNLEITRLYPKYSATPAGKLLADAQKLLSESKNSTDLSKKLELQIKAAQLQQKAMQQLSATYTPVVTANLIDNQQQPTPPPTPTQQPAIAQQNKNQQQTTPPPTPTQQPAIAQQNKNQQQATPPPTPTQQPAIAQQNKNQQQTTPPPTPTQQPAIAQQNKNQQQKTPQPTPTQQPAIAQQNKNQQQTTPQPTPTQQPAIAQQNKNQQQSITNNFLPQIKSIQISRTPAYSDANPIPLNPQLPEGLIFSVQVGAFKNPLPNNFFNGINPVFSQTTENNLYRYLIGQMQDPQEAIALKNNFRNLGYTDAFVIAYYNGKRISLSEALELLKKQKQQEIAVNPFATTNVLEKANIPTYTTLLQTTQQANISELSASSIKESEEINDLYFTIQIGVYGKNVSDATFKYIKPIIRSTINDKFYRYSAGIYDNITQVQKDLNKVIALGIKDAFICAYWNGKRLFYPEAEKMIRENKNIRYAPPQPIIFPNEVVASNLGLNNNPTANNAIIEQSPNTPPFDPTLVFSNGVTKRPEPTPENGVKPDNAGICFRVQIGAFKNRVPKETADKYFKIKDWPIEVHYINGLYIYTIGNFVAPKYAAKLREQVIALGITDAFITVYKDNRKLFGYEALKYLNQ